MASETKVIASVNLSLRYRRNFYFYTYYSVQEKIIIKSPPPIGVKKESASLQNHTCILSNSLFRSDHDCIPATSVFWF